jgi:hypothetical protein
VTVSADLSYPAGAVTPFLNLGYRMLGDPPGVDLRSGPTASAGASVQAGRLILIGSYDFARASSPATRDYHALFGSVSRPLAAA